MERPRRSFTEAYKRQAVEPVLSSGHSITSVANELGLRDLMAVATVAFIPGKEMAAAGRARRAGHDPLRFRRA
jgi:hypothetical protein